MHRSRAHRIAASAIAGMAAGLAACAASEAVQAPDVVEVVLAPLPAEAMPSESEIASPAVPVDRRRKSEVTQRNANPKECCRGRNACKGKGNCKVSGRHACKGMNDCKGQGGCTAADCLAKHRRATSP